MKTRSTRLPRSKATGQSPSTLYVSPSGSDRSTGTSPQPSVKGNDGPVATVARARDIAAAWLKRDPAKPVRIVLRAGVHFLRETLLLNAADSGRPDRPVVYAAFPGETPLLSGGRLITGWRNESVRDHACWVADLPDVANGSWNFTQLFVNGQRRSRPRLPKTGFFHFDDKRPDDFKGGLVRYGNGPTHAYFRHADLSTFHNLADVKLTTFEAWFESHHMLRAVDLKNRVVHFQSRGFGSGYNGPHSRYIVENIFEALDTPGQWYLDRSAGRLYYLPLPDEDPATTQVIAPRLETLLRIDGTPEAPAHDIHFENLTFAHTQWDYAPDLAGSMQAADLVPGAIQFRNADRCALFGCTISQIAQYGVEMLEGCHRNAVVGCVIRDMGAGGVKVGHEEHPGPPNCVSPIAASSRGLPMATTIADNIIHDGGVLFPSAVGVWIGNAGQNRVLHNHIFDLHYTGISCGWIWGHAPSRAIQNRIEHNHVHHIAWDRLLHDLGAIYTLSVQPGTTIRRNHVHHVGGNGIYLDEGSSQILVEENLAHHLDNLGFTLHYGRDNLVRRNILALSGVAHMLPASIERHRSLVHSSNVLYWNKGRFVANPWGASDNWLPDYSLFRDSLLWDARGFNDLDFSRGMRLHEWQARGQHVGTKIADPLFVDPEGGDFSLRPDSPLIEAGITPLDPATVGPRWGAVRPASFKAWQKMFDRQTPAAVVTTTLEQPQPNLLRVVIQNLGSAPAKGALRLRAFPAHAIAFAGKSTLAFSLLKPGKTLTYDIPVRTQPGAPRRILIDTMPTGDVAIPAAIHFTLPIPDWSIPRLPDTSTLARTLAKLPPQAVTTHRGEVCAQLRAALAGEDFVVAFEVTDRAIKQGPLAWQGSCIELFATPAESGQWHPSLGNPDVRQLFIVPPEGDSPARARRQSNVELPAPEVTLDCTPTKAGYRGTARIPLTLMGLKPTRDAARFLFQSVVTTTLQPGRGPERAAAFYGGISAAGSNLAYGLVETR